MSPRLNTYFDLCGIDDLNRLEVELPLLEYPHQLVHYNQKTLSRQPGVSSQEG